MTRSLIAWLTLLLAVTDTYAQTPIIYDSGDTVPLMREVAATRKTESDTGITLEWIERQKQKRAQRQSHSSYYPIRTPGMSLGTVQPRRVNFQHQLFPLCVVGADRRSQAWITTNYESLVKTKAYCWIVDVPNQAAHTALEQTLGGIPSFAFAGNDIVKHYGITHYPVLISKEWVEQ